MDEISIEGMVKNAELDKLNAETKKIVAETEEIIKGRKLSFWSEIVKIIGGVVLGLGGVFVAMTQYDVAETRAKYAKDKQEVAERELKKAEMSRDAAREEENNYRDYVKNLKKEVDKYEKGNSKDVKEKLVYVQFEGDVNRQVINMLRSELKLLGYNAPGAERVSGDYRPMVKYFSASDESSAQELALKTQEFFKSKNCPIVITPELIKMTSPPSHLELWIPHKC